MFSIAGQTAVPNGLIFLRKPMVTLGVTTYIGKTNSKICIFQNLNKKKSELKKKTLIPRATPGPSASHI